MFIGLNMDNSIVKKKKKKEQNVFYLFFLFFLIYIGLYLFTTFKSGKGV